MRLGYNIEAFGLASLLDLIFVTYCRYKVRHFIECVDYV
jgi:hypothetical protein